MAMAREVAAPWRQANQGTPGTPVSPLHAEATVVREPSHDEHVQERWEKQNRKSIVELGSRMLLSVAICGAVTRFILYMMCVADHVPLTRCTVLMEWSFLFGLVCALSLCRARPHAAHMYTLYCSIVLLSYVYLLMLPLPPLAEVAHPRYPETGHARCGLQDKTFVEVTMLWVLISPHFLPENWMFLNFVWVWVPYLGATVCSLHMQSCVWGESWQNIALIVILLNIVAAFARKSKSYMMKRQRKRFGYDLMAVEASRKMFCILECMVPVHVIVPMVKSPGGYVADHINQASILFIVFVDFEQTARRLAPADLLDFLNKHFTRFDKICQENDVMKIETVREEYVCSVGIAPADRKIDHHECLGRLMQVALDILRLDQEEEEVNIKMGAHTGEVVAGVIGHKLPRFRVFGDTINTAARMMQKGEAGELQFGDATYRELPEHWARRTVVRGEIELKGKGKLTAYQMGRKSGALERPRAPTAHSALSRLPKLTAPRELTLPAEEEHHPKAVRFRQISSSSSDDPPAGGERGDRACEEVEIEMQFMNERATTPTHHSRMSMVPTMSQERHQRRGNRTLVALVSEEEEDKGSSTADREERLFEELVGQLGSRRVTPVDWKTWLKSLGMRGNEFDKETEKGFRQWFHAKTCQNLERLLDKEALALALLTALEISYTVMSSKAFLECHEFYDVVNHTSSRAAGPRAGGARQECERSMRLPVFLTCRIFSYFILMGWRAVAVSPTWLESSPGAAQKRMLASGCIVAFLTFISYDAISVHDSSKEPSSVEKINLELLFFPVFMMVTIQIPFLFIHQLLFIVVGAFCMLLARVHISTVPVRGAFRQMDIQKRGCMLLMVGTVLMACLARTAERSARERYKAERNVERTHDSIELILNTLMPEKVVEELGKLEQGMSPPTHVYQEATIAQSDLCGFTQLASKLKPSEVVQFIGELFGLFDNLTDQYKIYKVETVGDAYIAGQAEEPLTVSNKPLDILVFGLDMIRATHEWSRDKGENVTCRVGVHHGKCIGGIVGTEMRRYHLFGEFMGQLDLLEATSLEGKVQVSATAKQAAQKQMREEEIPTEVIIFEERMEEHLMTSKGEVHEYDEVGGKTFIARSYAHLRDAHLRRNRGSGGTTR